MKFISLNTQNFLTIQSASVALDERGLVLIQGENRDDTSTNSNGSGKSSIADALCWALYGVTARGISTDDVVNTKAKKDCVVRVTLLDEATTYEIIRHRKHTTHKNATHVVMNGSVTLHKATEKETQEVIDQIVGCSYEVFAASIYAGQEAMPDLPKMTDKQLKLLIEQAAGIERLEKAYNLARERMNALSSKQKALADAVNRAYLHLETKKRSVSMAKLSFDSFEEGREKRKTEFLNIALESERDIRSLAESVKRMNGSALIAERIALMKEIDGYKEMTVKRLPLSVALNKAESELTRAKTLLEGSVSHAKRFKENVDNAPAKMKEPCPECGKPHTIEELEEYVVHQKKMLIDALEMMRTRKAEVEAATTAVNQAKEALESFDKSLPDIAEQSKRVQELSDELLRIGAYKSKIDLLKKAYDLQKQLAEKALTEANPHKSLITSLAEEVKSLMKEYNDLQKDKKECEDELAIASDVVRVFGPAGVRAHILDTVTPFLNERTGEYLSVLTDGNISAVWNTLTKTAKGELREKFSIDVANDKGAQSFAGLSGGEKRKVRLATMLALQDLVASRATKPIRIWIGDEIDDALDKAGLERLMTLLERKARERGTVLVISHNELRDWIDQTITVIKEGGVSRVEGALVT